MLLGLIRLSREDILMLKGGMAVCLIANKRDGNNLEQHVVDALNIISFKNKLKQIRETRMGFL